MKIHHGGSSVVASHGVTSEANFQINASPQAFRILSSGLYSDKITAVLREIACNAVDAHVAAGKADEPIEVKLPTALDPSFYIKDWGTGLTDEQVKGLYTTYFLTNKDAAEDLIGGLGLGSKSPFSYTDSFMVTVAKDGVKRFYTAHLGKDGSPVITSLGDAVDADDDWQNGVMVSFPVVPKDVEEFRRKAVLVFRWFRVKPRILGLGAIEDPKYKLTGSNYQLGPPNDITSALVLMGNIPYPLNLARLGTDDPVISSLIHSKVLLDMPIGSVMPTASREELEYDPRTRENLIEALLGVGKEIANQVVEHVRESGATDWERMVALQRYAKDLPVAVGSRIDKFLLLADLPEDERRDISKRFGQGYVEMPTSVGRRYVLSKKNNRESELRVHMYWMSDVQKRQVARREVSGGFIARGSSSDRANVRYAEDVKIVIGDAPHSHERIKEFVRDAGKNVTRISITGVTKETLSAAETYAKEISDAFGGLPITRASELEEPELVRLKKAKAKGARVSADKLHAKKLVKYWDVSQGTSISCGVKPIQLSDVPEAGRYYLIMDRRRDPFEAPNGQRFDSFGMDKFMDAYQKLAQAGIPLENIGGVVIGTEAKVRAYGLKDAGWRELFTTVRDAFSAEAVVEALKAQVSTMPSLALDRHCWSRCNECLLVMLTKEASKNTSAWQAFEPVVKDHGPLRKMVRELVLAAMPKSPRGELRRKVDNMLQCWRGLTKQFEPLKLLYEVDLRQTLEEVYPLTAYLDIERLRKSAEQEPEKAANILRAALREQTELAKSPRRRSASSKGSELQLPLALCG